MTTILPRKKRKRGFSVAEVVVAMALIILLSVTGFMACYTGLAIQRNASLSVAVNNAADAFSGAFSLALNKTGGVSSSDEQKEAFVLEFNRQVGFALGSYVPDVRSLSEQAGYGLAQNWTAEAVNSSRTEQEATVLPDGTVTTETVEVVLCALSLSHEGEVNNTRYLFRYRYFNEQFTIEATINLIGSWYLDIEGFRAGSDTAIYETQEVFS